MSKIMTDRLRVNMAHTGKFVSYSRTFQGLHKDSHSVFKDFNFMKFTL